MSSNQLSYTFFIIILEIVKQRVGQKKKDPYSKKVAEENFQCCSKIKPDFFTLFYPKFFICAKSEQVNEGLIPK